MKIYKTIRQYISILLISLVSVCITSCQKSPINGFLDGQWQVMDVDPEEDPLFPEFDTNLYYCFSLHVCQLSIPGKVWITGNITYSENNLTISFPKDLSYVEYLILMQYGITSNPMIFSVEEKNKNMMLLKSDNSTVTLRRF